MDKYKALKLATTIIETLSQLAGEHCLPVRCDSAEEAALLASFVRGTAGERFQSTGNGKFRWFEASGDPVYDDLEVVFIRSAAVRRACSYCETMNDKSSVCCEVCDKPL